MSMKPTYDVVIVGAGPVGANAANLLGKYGVSTLILDREDDILQIPRAIGICEEGSRVLDAAGILEGFKPHTREIDKIRFDKEFGNTMFHTDVSQKINGYSEQSTFYQPHLEQHLRDGLKQYPHVDLSTSTECLQFLDKGTCVELRLRKNGKIIFVNCRYVLASDGASSLFRQMLGLSYKGRTYGQSWLIFDAQNDPMPGNVVVPIGDPKRPGITLPAPNGRRRWEFVVKADDDKEALFENEAIRELLSPWGDVDDMQIERKTIYTFHARIANQFRKGNVFLLGDAAHITPPFAGQGLMAGFRDGYNIAWKLRDVLSGKIGTHVLDSYETDRKPQVKQIIHFADFIGSMLLPQKRWAVALRGFMVKLTRLLGLHSPTKPLKMRKLSNHINGPIFRHKFISNFKGTGFELPQYEVSDQSGKTCLLDKLLEDRFCLLGFDQNPSDQLREQTQQSWRDLGGIFLEVNSSKAKGNASQESGCLCVSETHNRYAKFFGKGRKIKLIRPDKMIVRNCHSSQLDKVVSDYISKITGDT